MLVRGIVRIVRKPDTTLERHGMCTRQLRVGPLIPLVDQSVPSSAIDYLPSTGLQACNEALVIGSTNM